MSGKHRGPSSKGKVASFSRLTLDPQTAAALRALIEREQRSMANMISVLVTEAIQRRQARDTRRRVK